MRRKAKVDHNQAEIVAALEKAGAVVTSLAKVGDGVTDLLVSRAGKWYVLEVKNDKQPPSKRVLTPKQQAWHARQHAKVHIVKSPGEALQAVGAVTDAATQAWLRENY